MCGSGLILSPHRFSLKLLTSLTAIRTCLSSARGDMKTGNQLVGLDIGANAASNEGVPDVPSSTCKRPSYRPLCDVPRLKYPLSRVKILCIKVDTPKLKPSVPFMLFTRSRQHFEY